jgi:hypothetical protein
MATKRPYRIERWNGKEWCYCTSTASCKSASEKARQLGCSYGDCSMRVLNTSEPGWPETFTLQGDDEGFGPKPPDPNQHLPYVSWSVDYRVVKEHRGNPYITLEYSIVTARTPREAAKEALWKALHVQYNPQGDPVVKALYPVSIRRYVEPPPWSPCGPFCAYEDCGCYFGPGYY